MTKEEKEKKIQIIIYKALHREIRFQVLALIVNSLFLIVIYGLGLRMFMDTFNNITVLSSLSVSLAEKSLKPRESLPPPISDKLSLHLYLYMIS